MAVWGIARTCLEGITDLTTFTVLDEVTVDHSVVLDGSFGYNRDRFARTRLPDASVTNGETRGRVNIIADRCVETDGGCRGDQAGNHHLSWSLKFRVPVIAVLDEGTIH